MVLDCRALTGNPSPDDKLFNAALSSKNAARQTRRDTYISGLRGAAENQQVLDDVIKYTQATQWVAELGELTYLNPSEGAKFADTLAYLFDESWGSANSLRADVTKIKTSAQGVVNYVARINQAGRLNTLVFTFEEAVKRKGIDKQTAAALLYDSLEVGGVTATNATMGFTRGVRSFNEGRVRAWKDNMLSYGFDPDEIDAIQEMSTQIQTTMHETSLAAQALGVNLDTLEGVGFIPRQYTPQAKKYLSRQFQNDAVLDDRPLSSIPFSTVHNRSRGFNFLVPDDLVTLSVVTGQSPGLLYSGSSRVIVPGIDVARTSNKVAQSFNLSDLKRFKAYNPTVFIPKAANITDAVNRHVTRIVEQIDKAFAKYGIAYARKQDYDLLETVLDATGYDYVSFAGGKFIYSKTTPISNGSPVSRRISYYDQLPDISRIPNTLTVSGRQIHSSLPDVFRQRFASMTPEEFISNLDKSKLSALGIDTRFAYNDNRRIYIDDKPYVLEEQAGLATYELASDINNAYYLNAGLNSIKVRADTIGSALSKALASSGHPVSSDFLTERELFTIASSYEIDAVYWIKPDNTVALIPISPDSFTRFDYSSTLLAQFDPMSQTEYIRQTLTSEQIDNLYDIGVLSKVAMTSVEVQDYLRAKYKMPFETLDSMVETDPQTLMANYVSSLMRATENSAFINLLADSAADTAGWAVRQEDIIKGSPQENWPTLGDVSSRLENSGFAVDLGQASSKRVHPRIADIIHQTMKVSSDPTHLHMMAYYIRKATSLMNSLALSARFHMYPISNALTNYVIGTLAGLNPLRLPVNLGDVFRVFGQGIESFDDVRQVYNVTGVAGTPIRTKRQLFAEFMKSNGAGYAPGVSGVVTKSYTDVASLVADSFSWLTDGPRKLPNALAELYNLFVADAEKIGVTRDITTRLFDTLSLGASQFNRQALKNFAPLGFLANLLELGIKWSVYESVAKRSDWSVAQLGKFIGGRYTEFSTIEELNRHMADYFIRPETVGSAIQWAEIVFPYLRYAWKTPFIIMRDVARRPYFYYSLYRFRAAYEDYQNDRLDIKEAGIEPWLADTYPLILGGKRKPNGDIEEVWYLLTDAWDPITQTMNITNDSFGLLGTALGLPGGTSGQERAELRGDLWTNTANSIISNTHPIWKTILEQATGVDSFTGRPISSSSTRYSWNGIPVTDRQRQILENIPVLDAIDKANPGWFAGQSPIVDGNGNVILPGKPAWFTNAQRRPGADNKKIRLGEASTALKIMSLAGLNIRFSNYDRNLQTTWNDIDKTIKDVGQDLDQERNKLKSDIAKGLYVSEDEKSRFIKKWNDRVAILGQLQYDKLKLQAYMSSRGILDGSSLNELNKLEASVTEVLNGPLLPTDEAINAVSRDILLQLQQNEEVFSGSN